MTNLDDVFKGMKCFRTGSSVICDPPVTTNDIDIVIIYDAAVSHALQEKGFDISPHEEYPNQNIKACYRYGDINIIAVADEPTYRLWEKATKLATLMNLKEKHQRIILFQFITEGCVRDTNIRYTDKQEVVATNVDVF